MSVRTKFVCTSKQLMEFEQDYFGEKVTPAKLHFTAVWEGFKDNDSSKGPLCEENRVFGEATPNGRVELYIANPEAHARFEQGKAYYIDISPAPTREWDSEQGAYVLKG